MSGTHDKSDMWSWFGIGKDPVGNCLACQGTGQAHRALRGTLSVPRPCPECGGTGKRPNEPTPSSGESALLDANDRLGERLRAMPHKYEEIGLPCYLCEAADRIAELSKEVVEWQEAGTSAMDRCRETHGKHFLLVGGMMESGDGAVPAVPFHEEPICEGAVEAAERLTDALQGTTALLDKAESENTRLTEQVAELTKGDVLHGATLIRLGNAENARLIKENDNLRFALAARCRDSARSEAKE